MPSLLRLNPAQSYHCITELNDWLRGSFSIYISMTIENYAGQFHASSQVIHRFPPPLCQLQHHNKYNILVRCSGY